MIHVETMRMALSRLTQHKVRTFLTMLGVLIGTAAVVALVSIGRGASSDVTSNIEQLGTNLLTVNAGSSSTGGVRGAAGSATSLTVEDGDAVADLDGVDLVAPEAQTQALVVAGDSNTTTSIVGTTPHYLDVRAHEIQRGAFITELAQRERLPVAVLGASVVETLGLTSADAVGTTITIAGHPFEVVGVLQPKGATGPMDPDDQVVVPLSVVQRGMTGESSVRTLGVSVESGADQTLVQQRIEALMRVRHGLASGADDDFTVTSQSQLLETFEGVNDTLTWLLGGVAAISLLVGGIGIMNMMLVAVQERTYEIGLRKALGARRRDVLVQFVAEAIVVSVLGGALGIVVGVAAARIASGVAGWDTEISQASLVLSFGFSVAVGVVFGAIPAQAAARLDPVKALRYQ